MKDRTIEQAFKDMAQMRDEIRLRIHLAGMEARDSWKRLEPRLAEVEAAVAHAGETAATELATSVGKLRGQLQALRERVFTTTPPAQHR